MRHLLYFVPAVIAVFISASVSAQSKLDVSAAKAMARSYGYSESEINSMLNQATEKTPVSQSPTTPTTSAAPMTTTTTTTTTTYPTAPNAFTTPSAPTIFNSSLPNADGATIDATKKLSQTSPEDIYGHAFLTSSGLSIIPSYNAPVPESYIIGPGDELTLDIWGATVSHVEGAVNNDGGISIPDLGPVYLSGKTVYEAEIFLVEQLGRIYSGLLEDVPDTFLKLSINKIKGVSINVTGEVVTPGLYSIPSLATIPSVIFMAGGVKEQSSVRNMSLFRHGRKVAVFDLYDFLFNGKFDENLRIQDGDVINVEAYSKVVSIEGAVARPMRYEIIEGETIKDLISYANGFTTNAQKSSVNVHRKDATGNRSIDVPEAEFGSFRLLDGDRVSVRSYLSFDQNSVSINGPVKYPGAYSLGTDIHDLASLLKAAGGLVEGAYTGKGQISRLNKNRQPEFLTFDVGQVMNGSKSIALQREDLVTIYSYEDMNIDRSVTISGAVVKPGVYSYKDSITIGKVINAAGGLDPDAYVASGQIIREGADGHPVIVPFDVQKAMQDTLEMGLIQGDAVYIYRVSEIKKNTTVSISGEVNAPGEYIFREGMTLEELVGLAHGCTHGVDLTNVEVTSRGGRERGSITTLDIEKNEDLWKKELKPFDVVTFRRLTYFRKQMTITVNGEAISPGPYTFDEAEVRLSDVISRIGGFTDAAYVKGAKLTRVLTKEEIERQELAVKIANQNLDKDTIDIGEVSDRFYIGIELEKAIKNPGSVSDVTLRDGDIIEIPILNNTVKISGGVSYPNTVAFDKNLSWKDYIRQAGGFTKHARKRKAYAVYMNGQVAVGKRIKNEPGMEIIVPEKNVDEERRVTPMEITSITTSAISMASMIITMIRLLK